METCTLLLLITSSTCVAVLVLVVARLLWRYARGIDAHNTKQTKPNRP